VQQDAVGNVTATTDTSGNVYERLIYDPYGTPTTLQANWQPGSYGTYLAYGFQGGRTDPISGLVHFGARDYDPALQRWVQAEPFETDYYDGMNLYEAMGSNPVSVVDPTGFAADDSEGGAEHTKNARPSTEQQHEVGQARKQRDRGGEKKDLGMEYDPMGGNPKKEAARKARQEAAEAEARRAAREAEAKAAAEAARSLTPAEKEALEKSAREFAEELGKKGRRFSRAIPWIGWGIIICDFASQREAKGDVGAALNAALDATPGIGDLKAAGELAAGTDLIPDKADRPDARLHRFMKKNGIPEATEYGPMNPIIDNARILNQLNKDTGGQDLDPTQPPY